MGVFLLVFIKGSNTGKGYKNLGVKALAFLTVRLNRRVLLSSTAEETKTGKV